MIFQRIHNTVPGSCIFIDSELQESVGLLCIEPLDPIPMNVDKALANFVILRNYEEVVTLAGEGRNIEIACS